MHCVLIGTYQRVFVIVYKYMELNNDAINIEISIKFELAEVYVTHARFSQHQAI